MRKRRRLKPKYIRRRIFIVSLLVLLLLLIISGSRPKAPETNSDVGLAASLEPIKHEEATVYFDCPLPRDLQDYIFTLCDQKNIQPSLVIAIIEQESDFQADLISTTNDYGLMQINACNHERLSKAHGITDFLDAKQNILAGVVMLSDLFCKYDDPHALMMAYNMGEAGAGKARANGIMATDYSRSVVEKWRAYEANYSIRKALKGLFK